MKKIVFIIFALLVSAALSPVYTIAQQFDFKMDQTLVIGKENSDSTQYLFSAIRWVRPDNNGNILVAGTSNNSIRVYDKQGNFVRSIGRRGRGPGEFYELTSVDIMDTGQIAVLDRRQSRVSFFSPGGELLRTENMKLGPNSTTHIFIQNKKHDTFIVARNYLTQGEKVHLIHQYDRLLKEQQGSYINTYQYFFDYSNSLHKALAEAPYFRATVFGNNRIAVLPRVYTGGIGILNINTLKEKQFGSPIDNFVTEYNWGTQDRYMDSNEIGFGSPSGPNGKYFYKRKGTNFGLVGNKNFLLHFYGLFKEDDIIPYMKVYNPEGKLLANVSLKKHGIPFISERTTFSRIPHFLDENNRLYIGDYSYKERYPAARIFETNLDVLLK